MAKKILEQNRVIVTINGKGEFDSVVLQPGIESDYTYNFKEVTALPIIPWSTYYCWDCGEGWILSTADYCLSCGSHSVVLVD